MRVISFLLILAAANPALAQELDKDQVTALNQTKDLLKDPVERQKAINLDPKAKDIDNKVNALAGTGANKEAIYDVASQLMDKIAADAHGDPEKMQELMSEAAKNPEAFRNKYFSEDQKNQVRGIANKIEADKPPLDKK